MSICSAIRVTAILGALALASFFAVARGQTSWIFGNSTLMENESLFFYKGPTDATAVSHLLFPATHIRQLTNRAGDVLFEEGKDFTLSADKVTIVLTPNSRIPFDTPADLYVKPNAANGISYKIGDPNTWLLWSEQAPFLKVQCAVTYEHDPGLWKGFVPAFAAQTLPKTMAKLKNKEPLTIGVTGDSISYGGEATIFHNLPPFRAPFFPQVVDGLKAFYGGPVVLKNHAVPGWSASNGLKDLPNVLADKPDLIFIAYGMNDVAGNDARGYGKNIKAIMDQIHQALPQCELILVSSSIGNPEWCMTPRERFPVYRDELKKLTGPGCDFVDITGVWEELLKHKTFWDITGNGVNHPNDFCHRIYAEMILRLLVPFPSGS